MSEDQEKPRGEVVVYQTEDGRNRIQVKFQGETVWMTQRALADLYEIRVPTVNHHISAIYEDGELAPEATVRKYLIVQSEGARQVRRTVDHYSLDMILAVGYRVRSPRGVQFRQWATERLSEYLIKGFTLDDERLKGTDQRADYFDELLARIRDIRASEARVYQRIREIFALAVDYVPDDKKTQLFFATMQNKMHFAATGRTAAEIIFDRADAKKPNMGLTTWRGGRVAKTDIVTAKNYLDAQEIDTLNRIVVMFLDQAEFRAHRRRDIRMADWEIFLDKFLGDTELPILEDAGSVSHKKALARANTEYDEFTEKRRIEAEAVAEERYLDDLRTSAEILEGARKQPTKNAATKAKRKPKQRERKG